MWDCSSKCLIYVVCIRVYNSFWKLLFLCSLKFFVFDLDYLCTLMIVSIEKPAGNFRQSQLISHLKHLASGGLAKLIAYVAQAYPQQTYYIIRPLLSEHGDSLEMDRLGLWFSLLGFRSLLLHIWMVRYWIFSLKNTTTARSKCLCYVFWTWDNPKR